MKKLWQWIVTALLLACTWAALPARAADADVVGMVLDVQGSGEVQQKDRENKDTTSKLQLLGYVKNGAKIKLDAVSKASVSHYGAKLIYQMTGPVVAEVNADGLKVISGKPPVTKSLAEKIVQAAVNPNLGAAAFKMRALGQEIAVLSPSARSKQVTARPRFQWSAPEPGTFDITVTELPDTVVQRATVDGMVWDLPAGVKLVPGKDYRWSVNGTAPDGQARSATATFSIATQAEADSVLGLRPASSAAVEEWVLYVAILRDRGMVDEARDVWRIIASQRPDLSSANPLAR
ncbi:hypothetical protein GCM10027277_38100 [Pseudoduganella ginsengisoli]|uniref:Uncharacterized protein n=1 Tax=Pseudoduganella ginsengisoli TaxID=1462440 RepID=A0A6L6Q8L1_9BURK|nr:hypothetical protein [Pseudoduganella ginsengisoli]MTW05980.1 hypothetical protein [Pseudoduganella ginsengisoli]